MERLGMTLINQAHGKQKMKDPRDFYIYTYMNGWFPWDNWYIYLYT